MTRQDNKNETKAAENVAHKNDGNHLKQWLDNSGTHGKIYIEKLFHIYTIHIECV